MINALEIDFLPVGENSKSGDAIALRFGLYENSRWKNQTVFIIDGGDNSSGEALVEHVRNIYNTNIVDRVILTHPDSDHASGLRKVIEELEVKKIWMHRPWNHWDDIKNSIVDGRITKNSFGEKVRSAYQFAHDIEKLANEKKIEIFSPNQGATFSINSEKILTVLGPSKELYLSLIQASGKTPEMNIFESVRTFSTEKTKIVNEDYSFESENLADSDLPTSPENDMSLNMLLTVAGAKVLFTGDSGTQGLYKSIMYSIENNISLKDLDIFDVPHHGSRRNLSKGILKYINAKYSIISCSKEGSPKHPSPIVTNSLHRRNMNPHWTKGRLINFRAGSAPSRPDLISIETIPFFNTVEIPNE